MNRALLVWMGLVVSLPTAQAAFTDINAGLPGIGACSVAWGDYDNDGDLDVLLAGAAGSGPPICRIYRSNGNGTFTDINANLPGIAFCSVAWGDYDNDGDLDVLLAGYTDAGSPATAISRIYRNNGNDTFTDIGAGLPGIAGCSVWGDYDNDGDLDVLLAGYTGSAYICRIYRNNSNGTFTDINAGLPGIGACSVAWGDYDNDGDLDVLLAGLDGSGGGLCRIYRNNGNGTFTDINAGLQGIYLCSVAWGDYDNDGDLDVLLAGGAGCFSCNRGQIYRNNGNGTFTDINAGLPGIQQCSVAWGDYDNDGDLDVLLAGYTDAGIPATAISRIYRNNGNGTFTEINAGLPGIQQCSVAWGDYDNDGDLDVLLAGGSGSSSICRIYQNTGGSIDSPPNAPSNLIVSYNASTVNLNWTAASDSQTPANGLTYNLRVGTTPGGSEIVAPESLASGRRLIAAMGRQQHGTFAVLNVPPGQFYWSVQAVDGAFAGGPFAPERSFFGTPPCVTPPDGLVGWWPSDGTTYDIVGLNDGTLQNGAGFAAGKVGQAFSFDGVNDYVLIGNPPALRLTNGITLEAWINPQDNLTEGGLSAIITKWGFDATRDSYGLFLYKEGGVLKLLSAIGVYLAGDGGLVGGVVASNQWNHVVMTYDSIRSTNRLFLNGVQVAERFKPGGIFDTNLNVMIGREDSATMPRPFAGLIDEVEIFDRALQVSEIESIYIGGAAGKCRPWTPLACVPAPPDLLAWWTGDGTADERFGHYDGSWIGAAAYQAGKVGAAFSLAGATTHYVQTSNSAGLNPNPGGFTIEAWVNISRRNVAVVGKGLTSPFDYSFGINSTGAVRMAVSASQLQPPYTAAGGVVTSNQWHHIAGVFQPFQSVTVFLDGILVGSVSAPDFQPPMTANLVTIGRANGFGPLAGRIDELCFYNRALFSGEIATLYLAGTGGKCWQPYLGVRPAPQGLSTGIVVFWPVSERWYRLQQAPVVSGGTWADVLATPACTNNECQVLLPASGNRFFRLVAP